MIYSERFEDKIGFIRVRKRLSELCHTPMGREWVKEMEFGTDFDSIRHKLVCICEMQRARSTDTGVPGLVCEDVNPILKSLELGRGHLTGAEFTSLKRVLSIITDVKRFFVSSNPEDALPEYPRLKESTDRMENFEPQIKAINRIVDDHGGVLDTASPELGEIRRELSRMSGRVNSVMRNVMARAQNEGLLDADAKPTVRDGRLVLPVAPMNKRKLMGIVHDESATGKTIFIEPAEVVETNNRIRELEISEKREIAKILSELSDEIRPHSGPMRSSVEILGEIDFIHAKSLYADETDAHMPNLSAGTELEWYHACHPVLIDTLRAQGKDVVPLDILLDHDHRILVISGPNAGGKSVCLKTVGIVQYMLQCGILPTVYENSHMGLFHSIMIDIGDDQNMESDLSTYSSHLRNMRDILQRGNSRTLVLIDEFGGGTEPQIGGALAQAMLHRMNDLKMWGVITTHYQNLKKYAQEHKGLINGSMLYDRQRMEPLFKLSIGNAGSSFAVEIARKTGLPKEIIDEAIETVGSDYVNLDRYLLDVARDKKYWENKRQNIRQKEKRLEEILDRYETDAEKLRLQRKEIIAQAKEEAQKIISGSNARIERTIAEIRRAQADKERTREARKNLKEDIDKLVASPDTQPESLRRAPRPKKKPTPAPASKPPTAEINVGDTVQLDGTGEPGKVISIEGSKATVVFGMLKTSVEKKRLKHTLLKVKSGAKASSFVSASTSNEMRTRQLNFKPDIDVRGMRADEAVQAVSYFIDDAIQFSIDRVRILHGTGTGALKVAIRKYLDTIRGVKSYRDEHVQFGGAGITVIDLE